MAGAPFSVPDSKDALPLIEEADTTLTCDRNTKLPLYAKGGIAKSWIVNISAAAPQAPQREIHRPCLWERLRAIDFTVHALN